MFKNLVEVPRPLLKTRIPGPKSKQLINQLGKHQDPRSAFFVQDLEKSVGNYIADADGNHLLDLYCQIASIAIGYNNKELIEAAQSPKWIRASINRPALGVFPNMEWMETMENSLVKVKPPGLDQVFTTMCGSCANEIAFKAAFIYQQAKKRAGTDFTPLELESCMKNQEPGSPSYAILSFSQGFHGRTLASLSATRSKAIHKIDIPALNWPKAPFPQLKYPLEENQEFNQKEEENCLAQVKQLLETWPIPVAAIIVEPIQGEGGDNHASPAFFQGLRDITKELGVLMIVDEVQTGVGATGTFWAHEQWNLTQPPDFVTFSKKMQIAGFYHNLDTRPLQPFRNFNTWMGDPIRLYEAQVIIDVIEKYQLLNKVKNTGDYIRKNLLELSSRFPIENIRGKGTHIAFDYGRRDDLIYDIRQRGINMGGSGARSIRLRPMLTLETKHADIFLETLEETLKSIRLRE